MSQFFVWLHWLYELGGRYEYCGVLPGEVEPDTKPKTGRRNPDTKPRTYQLGKDYYTAKNGVTYKVLHF